tara:strand:+ start:1645 stop:2568 length:924 start_codon:yes stop_codon:yes gene_type:complete
MSVQTDMLDKFTNSSGFISALDQSGGSTPSALEHYGIKPESIQTQKEMFEAIHEMRTRIILSASFTSQRVIGAILFKDTLDRKIQGIPTDEYLWKTKFIIPFLKIDDGLKNEVDGVRLMKPIKNLHSILSDAKNKTILGTKMRSVINKANEKGIRALIKQQFSVAREVLKFDLIPIIEPEVSIHCHDKGYAELMLKDAIDEELGHIDVEQRIILKLTLPEVSNTYEDINSHPKILRILALSGGYTLEEANQKLTENDKIIASFSRALLGRLYFSMSDEEFNRELNSTIEAIFKASIYKVQKYSSPTL